VIFTKNYGEAGAIDLFGPARGLPQAYSGHNGFSEWGPPPNSDTAAILVGEELKATVAADFRGCAVRAHIDDGLDLNNQEQGVPVWFCAATSRSWSTMWTSLRHYN
jgi:hypothetical protein